MRDEHDTPSKRKPPIAVPITLIALGATAVVVPVILLRRTRGRMSRSLGDLHGAPPPIRRVQGLNSHSSSSTTGESYAPSVPQVNSQHEVASPVGLQKPPDVSLQPVLNRSQKSGALYALKALGIATCIVGVSAGTVVFAVRWMLGVQSVEEFSGRVRTKIQSLTPMLSTKIYQNHADSPIEAEWEESEEWTWAEAAERLSKAYDEGGLAKWIEVAEKELGQEVNDERKRRARR